MSQLLVVKERLQNILRLATHDRDDRPELVPTPVGKDTEPAWAAHEREVMHKAVNEERAKLSKAPLDLTDIMQVEQLAVGHADYAEKFPLYCAELVLSEK
jgi:hypothetical protein